MNYDVIIIGGGAAGLSAALWCDELGLNALLLESGTELGGQLLRVYNPVKNHLGVDAENGLALRDVFLKQIESRQFIIRLQSEISLINWESKQILLATGETLFARFLIVATGVRRRKLNVEGEDEFKDKGIIESGKRDANLIAGKRACVIGGGDAAFENALLLAVTASSVTLIYRGKEFRARTEFVEQARNNRKIKILTETTVRKITGNEQIEFIELENTATKEKIEIKTEVILIRIGVEPNTKFLRGRAALDESGYIKINQNGETSVKGVFAVGDVANPLAPTVSSAVGMGATAAKVISSKLQIK